MEKIDILRKLSRKFPGNVVERLEQGQTIEKSSGLSYLIDNTEIDRRLGDFEEGVIPYGQIYKGFRGSPGDIFKQFNGRKVIPFSEIFDKGLGECLEKAILVQFAAQRKESSFLINGVLCVDSEEGAGFHAYNIVFRNGSPILVDAQNPAMVGSDGKVYPYTAPVIDIKEDGVFWVSPEWRFGRTYSID